MKSKKVEEKSSSKLMYCKNCDKEVLPIPKVMGVKLCPLCNIILDGGTYGINKGDKK